MAMDEDVDDEGEHADLTGADPEEAVDAGPPEEKPAQDLLRFAQKDPRAPLLTLSDQDIEDRYKKDPASLGSMSVGRPNAGVLVNGVQMPAGERWLLLDPGRAWGTRETVDALSLIIHRVNERFPQGTSPLPIGHISAERGGRLSPHKSHQSGRDVDAGYYYKTATHRAFVPAHAGNLDLDRTWALIKAALIETPVEMILVDTSIQRLLADHALKSGEDPAFVERSFQVKRKNGWAPVRHAHGHHNHIHFRFFNPVGEALGQKVARLVLPRHPAPGPGPAGSPPGAPAVVYENHRARSGDTMGILARRYGTTPEEIRKVNGLKSDALRAGVVYKIPHKGAAPPPPQAPKHGKHSPAPHAQHPKRVGAVVPRGAGGAAPKKPAPAKPAPPPAKPAPPPSKPAPPPAKPPAK